MPIDMALPPSVIDADALVQRIEEVAEHIRFRWGRVPSVGIILGTGLGSFAEEIATEATFPYEHVPHIPGSMAIGHKGQLTCGTVHGVPIIAMEGRFHVYEGHPAWQITLPVRVMRRLGIELLIVSNAAGAVNPQYRVGDVMAIEDHVNLMGANPLIGGTNETLGGRFPDMSRPYEPGLIDRAQQIARQAGFACHRGVYVALRGPNYETRAEYRFLRKVGGDVVGMSTVPEVIVARQLGLRVMALSCVTNVCLPDALGKTSGDDVIVAAAQAESKLRAIVLGVIGDLRGTRTSDDTDRADRRG